MTRYKGRTSAKSIEREFPHVVEMPVPPGGLRARLDAMHDWHRARGIEARNGRGRHTDECDYITWCFGDPKSAGEFQAEFLPPELPPDGSG